ncbi:MAG: CocE/NonD family hydrolase [Thermoplasmata archaeon]|nr:CocE/NonD family hydrolase [Thermoplasmata archaeon]
MGSLRLLRADLRSIGESITSKARKHLLMPLQSIDAGDDDSHGPISVRRNITVPMRDGVRLYADVYMPKPEGKYPTILTRLPYGKSEYGSWSPVYGRFWARRGYAFVVQDVRGKFKSNGVWKPFVNEVDDGYDTIEWISKQPWCDGNIGAIGESYLGYTCWAAGLSGHPSLKCISPGMTATDVYGIWAYRNGAFCIETAGSWLIAEESRKYQNSHRLDYWTLPLESLGDSAGLRSSHYKQWLSHPRRDSYWDRIDLSCRIRDIAIPVLHTGGWLDVFLDGTLGDWERANAASNRDAASRQWLVIGPNDHSSNTNAVRRAGRVNLGPPEPDRLYAASRDFFDHWLKGTDNGFGSSPRIKYFTIGENSWRTSDVWPPKSIRPTDMYLHSSGKANSLDGDGTLSTDSPEGESADEYTYDPKCPATWSLESDMWNVAMCQHDRRSVEKRNDVLVYSTPRLRRDLELTGPITATLFASTSAEDTDFMVAVVDVFPDGYAQMIQEGVVRASYRQSDRKASQVPKGAIQEYTIGLRATSYVVKEQHRIRAEVTSSDFNRYSRNLNTGEDPRSGTRTEIAKQRILHDRNHPSKVTISVIGDLEGAFR